MTMIINISLLFVILTGVIGAFLYEFGYRRGYTMGYAQGARDMWEHDKGDMGLADDERW